MKKIMTVLFIVTSFFVASPAFAYTVSNGDTMSRIARDNGISLEELAKANPQIDDLDFIYVGQTVHVKTSNTADSNLQEDHSEEGHLFEMEGKYSAEVLSSGIDEKSSLIEDATKNQKDVSFSDADIANSVNENFTKDEIDLLARLVRSEAKTEPFEGKMAVAEVVLNRVKSTQFPDTIKNVIYQPGQFQPVSNGEINKPADEESIKAVKTALSDGHNMAGDSLFFYNPDIATNRWLDTRETTVVIGDHVFKK